MFLQGKKIQLRAIEPSDVNIIYKWENNLNNWQLSNTLTPFSKNIIEQYIETSHRDIYENKQLRLMIDTKEYKTVGAIDLFDFDPYNQRTGVGILINETQDRRNAYASEALELLINYCRDVLALKQLYCNISINKEASIALFEKLNFEQTGLKKQWQRVAHNKWEDVLFFQLIF